MIISYFLLQKRKILSRNFRYSFKFKQEYNGKYYNHENPIKLIFQKKKNIDQNKRNIITKII